jgi:predicted metal-dependent phosphoesterase TrpH
MGRVLIDLHAHSTASDGTDTPAELMQAAAAAGLDVVAITDHDNTMGWAPALAARPPGLTVIRGAEFSTSVSMGPRRVSVHLLGYLFDPAHRAIVQEQARLREERLHRGLAIVERMVAAGVPITADRVLEIADGAPVGRPHIGRALVEAGVVESVDQAFAMHLSGRGPYYMPKADTDLPRAIGMITAAGGVSVIAHPRGRGERTVLTADYLADPARARWAGGRPPGPRRAGAGRTAGHCREPEPADDRFVGLSRHQQGAAAGPGAHRPGRAGQDRRGEQRDHRTGRSRRVRSDAQPDPPPAPEPPA